MRALFFLFFGTLLIGCKQKPSQNIEEVQVQNKFNFELQGHRGARGLAPENSIIAFKKALEIGVNTLELDVVVTKDKRLLVSHEPWFNRHICLDSTEQKIAVKDTLKYNIYQHTYKQTLAYDCGSIGNANFPDQEKQKITKPLLTDVIRIAKNYNERINFNIEIKSQSQGDLIYHPIPKEFSELLIEVLKEHVSTNDVVIQSFDFRVLQYLHKKYPTYKLAALVYKDDLQTNLDTLGFIPAVYSPLHTMLSKKEIEKIHEKNMKVIPWTVNKPERMEELLSWKVDGIITDYPDRAKRFID